MDHKASYPDYKHPSFKGIIGAAQKDITPPVGIHSRNWGAAQYDSSIGIHRPIMLTCITFQSSVHEQPLVLMSADLGWWKSSEEEQLFRTGIIRALSLEPEQLMFCLTHTHAGPSIFREDISKGGGQFVAQYVDSIRNSAIDAAQSALRSALPSILTWHYGKCNLASNRDLPDKEKDRVIVGFNPEQPADDTLLVGRITNEEQRIIATIVNYACHPTTLAWENRLISPDYIGAMREVVESKTMAPCLFLQGASGNLAPSEQYTGDTSVADRHGFQLGYAVLSTLEGMLPPASKLSFDAVVESGAPLAVWKLVAHEPAEVILSKMIAVPFPLKPMPSLAEIEKQWHACEDRVLKERLRRKRSVRRTVGDGEVAYMLLWVWQLGDSFLFGQPDEAYQDLQLELRRKLAPAAVAVMNLVNGTAGYLPPRELYTKDVYTVWQTPFAPGSLELLTQAALETATKMVIKNDYNERGVHAPR